MRKQDEYYVKNLNNKEKEEFPEIKMEPVYREKVERERGEA